MVVPNLSVETGAPENNDRLSALADFMLEVGSEYSFTSLDAIRESGLYSGSVMAVEISCSQDLGKLTDKGICQEYGVGYYRIVDFSSWPAKEQEMHSLWRKANGL